MARPASWLILVVVLAACVERPTNDGIDAPDDSRRFRSTEDLRFDVPAVVASTPNGAEPGAAIHPGGHLFVVAWTQVFRSIDGKAWEKLATPFQHNGDSDLTIDGVGRLHFVGMPLGNQPGPRLPYYRSEDLGQGWSEPRELGASARSIDRPWIESDGHGALVLTWNDFAGDQNLARVSRNDGNDWTEPVVIAEPRYKVPGPPIFVGATIVQPLNKFQSIDFAVTTDYGLTWRIVPGPSVQGGQFTGFPVMAADREGRLYMAVTSVLGSGFREVRLWSAPRIEGPWEGALRVAPGDGESVMPWVVAGEPGHVAVAYYFGAPAEDTRNAVEKLLQPKRGPFAAWSVEVAHFEGAQDLGSAMRRTTRTTPDPVRMGDICTSGAGCTQGRDWTFKDYFEMVPTEDGGLFVVHMTDAATGGYPIVAARSAP